MKTPKQRLEELKANPDDRRHGTTTGANLGCRCHACNLKRYEIAEERNKKRREKAARKAEHAKEREARTKLPPPSRSPKDCCTVDGLMLPLMGKPSIDNAFHRCCWCGAPATNLHHIVRRGAGKLVVGGREVSKPTVRLCGNGNADGCHAKAHAGLLHFRFVDQENKRVADPRGAVENGNGHWEGVETEEPMKYQEALSLTKGWRRL